MNKVKGKYFAIIIDEAHSSQTGESAKKVKEVLTTSLEQDYKDEEPEEDLVDKIEKEMKKRGPQKNLSYYAFTATPKKKTLQLFGTPTPQGIAIPFHRYSMKQAIEENFILDVLKTYVTYEQYFELIQTSDKDKIVQGRKASRALIKYVDTNNITLSKKAEVIIEHFRSHCQPKIGGLAKAMVVASSRVHAVKYKQQIDAYINLQNYQGIKTLVAFSGSLDDGSGNNITEHSINNTHSEQELRDKFNEPEYNILIVAEKYQTGYDQPLLHTMYVDKDLVGVKVVQTLSRINRVHPLLGKTDTFIVDFKNTVDEITKAFEPYYKGATLIDQTDLDYLFKLYDKIMLLKIITEDDLDKFAQVFFKPRSHQATTDHGNLYSITGKITDRFDDAEEMQKDQFKQNVIKYIETYSLFSQIVTYKNIKLEKLFVFAKFIVNDDFFRSDVPTLPELRGDVLLDWYRLEKTHEDDISFGIKGRPLIAKNETAIRKTPEVLTSLSNVIRAAAATTGISKC